MTIQNLKLTRFRNHGLASFDFIDGVNLIVGPNGSGKTNILEAINLLSTGKSFRARYDQEMILNPQIPHHNEDSGGVAAFASRVPDLAAHDTSRRDAPPPSPDREFCRVCGTVSDDSSEEALEIIIVKSGPYTNFSQKTFKVNGTSKPIYETTRYFSTVLFCPQDLDLFNGSPALRRKFLDDLLCKVDQKYKKEHTTYSKAVRQRNKVLEKINKMGSGGAGRGGDELSFWTDEILKTGAYLQEKRTELVQTLNNNIGQAYSDVSSQDTKVDLEYKMNQINLERLQKHHEHEIYAKTTLVGPHRDDLEFLINGFSIARYGSRGQQRTGVLALKICELNIIGQKNATSPVLLLDDIFSELDNAHKKALEEVVRRQQTIITSTHPDIKAQSVITL